MVLTIPYSVRSLSPATLYQILYLSSLLFLPPVESGSSHARVTDVLVELTTLTLRGGEGSSTVISVCACVYVAREGN